MQMHAVTSHDVVLMAGIDEQVGIRAGIHTSLYERERVLRHTSIVMVVVNQQKMSFQVAGKVLQVTILITFGIALRRVHISFSVHDFIIAPVDDRATCNAYLEYLRVAEHQCRSHVSAEAPAVYADAVGIHVRQGF